MGCDGGKNSAGMSSPLTTNTPGLDCWLLKSSSMPLASSTHEKLKYSGPLMFAFKSKMTSSLSTQIVSIVVGCGSFTGSSPMNTKPHVSNE